MLLMHWQVHNETSSENSEGQSGFYFESNYYWNQNWNETERKFMIPFKKHPKSDAQVSSFWRFVILTNIFQ